MILNHCLIIGLLNVPNAIENISPGNLHLYTYSGTLCTRKTNKLYQQIITRNIKRKFKYIRNASRIESSNVEHTLSETHIYKSFWF